MSEEENSDLDYSDNEIVRPRKSRKIRDDEDEDEDDDYSRRNYNSDEAEEDDNDNIDDDEDDEGDDIEETEEDKKFIVDDEGVEEEEDAEEEAEVSSHKKKKRKKHHSFKDSDSESDLDDEDRMLIAENTGIEWQKPEEKRFKRLKKRRQETSVPSSRDRGDQDLSKIFLDDEDAEEGEIKQQDEDREIYDEDDLRDFIDDDEDELTPEMREQRANERKEQKQFVKDIGESLGITDDSLFMIQQIFGDGSEYAYAMDINDMQDDDDVNDINRENTVRLKDVYEPDEIAERLLTEEDDAIRIKDIPERLQLRYINNLPEGDELNREAAYIEEKILIERAKYNNNRPDTSLQTPIKDVLRFIREDNYEVPFIFSHRKDFWRDKLVDNELWLIYDFDEEFQAIESKKKLLIQYMKIYVTIILKLRMINLLLNH